MIDLDAVLAHAHDNCAVCEGTGVVRCWSPGGPCPDGQTMCESCGPCQQSDVPALVAALREARAEVERTRASLGSMVEWLSEVIVDARDACEKAERIEPAGSSEWVTSGIAMRTTVLREIRLVLDRERNADPSRYDRAIAERDDWRRRYEALRADYNHLNERLDFAVETGSKMIKRYEALRDGVTGLCYDPDPDTDDGMTLISVDAIRAVVARVEGDES